MAEFVNQHLEEMVNELEQMRRMELYSNEEIREISNKRKEFEYKIQRRTKCKEDFLGYIAYECLLLRSIQMRREKCLIEEKKSDIEYSILKRLNKLFKELTCRFSDDLEIWLNYMKFCKNVDFLPVVTSHLEKIVQLHGDKPKVWQLASRWEYEEMNNIENARKFLFKGIHRHPTCQELYIDSIRIELLVAEACVDIDRENQLEKIEVIIENSLNQIDNVNFVIKLCSVTDNFDFAGRIHSYLYRQLWEKYLYNVETWNFIAKRELEEKSTYTFNWRSFSQDLNPLKYSSHLVNFVHVYETALTLKKIENVLVNYIENALKLPIEGNMCDPKTKLQILNHALSQGHTSHQLMEDHYKIWLNILCLDASVNRDEITMILKEASSYLPTSAYIWEERLRRTCDNSTELLKMFKLVKTAIPADTATPLWLYVIENMRDVDKLEKLYKESLTLPSGIASVVKPLILKEIYEYGDKSVGRQQYSIMTVSPPLVVELHNMAVEIELSFDKPDLKYCRNCYELAVQQFGTKCYDIWLDYIKFELTKGQPEHCGLLYSRACSNLNASVVDIFISKYNLLKNQNI